MPRAGYRPSSLSFRSSYAGTRFVFILRGCAMNCPSTHSPMLAFNSWWDGLRTENIRGALFDRLARGFAGRTGFETTYDCLRPFLGRSVMVSAMKFGVAEATYRYADDTSRETWLF